jgi:hypothetical protein
MTLDDPSRRSFLRTSAAFTAASFFVHADDKSGANPAIVGKGEQTYECHHNWGQVPDHIHWYETHNVAVDQEGLVYVTHRAGADKPKSPADAQDTVAVFDPQGKFVRSFGKAWHGGGHGIDIREEEGEEFLYLAFMFPVNLVVKTDKKGEVVWIKEKPTETDVYNKPDARFSPTNVAFAPDGGLYVADGYGSNYVHQYDKDAKYVRTWGGTGEGPGQYRTPHGIWLDNRPGRDVSLVVADRANARLQYSSLDGKYLSDDRDVSFPAHFDISGEVLLVPDLHARVTLLDKNNDVITHLGCDPEWTKKVLDGFKIRQQPLDWPNGRFIHPHDACFDKAGNIFVAEWVVPGRITWLRKVV